MNVAVPVRKVLGASVVTKCRIGFLIAVVAIISIGGRSALLTFGFLKGQDAVVCIGLAVTGFLLWLVGRLRDPSPAPAAAAPSSEAGVTFEAVPDPSADPSVDPSTVEHPLEFLRNLKYWGVILLVSAGALTTISQIRYTKPVVVHARQMTTNYVTVTNYVTITNEIFKAQFPQMVLDGVIVNGRKSSALINGQTIHVGEMLDNVRLVAVAPEHAAVELDGQIKLLMLKK